MDYFNSFVNNFWFSSSSINEVCPTFHVCDFLIPSSPYVLTYVCLHLVFLRICSLIFSEILQNDRNVETERVTLVFVRRHFGASGTYRVLNKGQWALHMPKPYLIQLVAWETIYGSPKRKLDGHVFFFFECTKSKFKNTWKIIKMSMKWVKKSLHG